MLTLEKVIGGLGSAGGAIYKDIYKAAKQCMTDRAMSVRYAAAKVIQLRVLVMYVRRASQSDIE